MITTTNSSQRVEPLASASKPKEPNMAPHEVTGAVEEPPVVPEAAAQPSDAEAFVKSRRQMSGE